MEWTVTFNIEASSIFECTTWISFLIRLLHPFWIVYLRCFVFTWIFIWFLACECNTKGTNGGSNNCDKRTGSCDYTPGCQTRYRGKDCGLCDDSYYGVFPECKCKFLLHMYRISSYKALPQKLPALLIVLALLCKYVG